MPPQARRSSATTRPRHAQPPRASGTERRAPSPRYRWRTSMGMVFAKLNCKPRWRERLSEIAIPTLVVHGRRDPFFPVGNGRALAREIPGARLLILKTAATAIPSVAADEVAAAMLALRRHPARRDAYMSEIPARTSSTTSGGTSSIPCSSRAWTSTCCRISSSTHPGTWSGSPGRGRHNGIPSRLSSSRSLVLRLTEPRSAAAEARLAHRIIPAEMRSETPFDPGALAASPDVKPLAGDARREIRRYLGDVDRNPSQTS